MNQQHIAALVVCSACRHGGLTALPIERQQRINRSTFLCVERGKPKRLDDRSLFGFRKVLFNYVVHKLAAILQVVNLSHYTGGALLYGNLPSVCSYNLIQSDDKIAELTPAVMLRHPMNGLEVSSPSLRALGECIASASEDHDAR